VTPKKRMLVIGARSQLGRAVSEALSRDWKDAGLAVSRVLVSGVRGRIEETNEIGRAHV
jgi:NAD(P)-dependent dehydrogenase (short-subunit alcohol dehydrogenase family)